MTADWIGFSLLMLAILLYAGKWVRMHWRPAQQLFLPASILAGAIGLLLGPGVLGAILEHFQSGAPTMEGEGGQTGHAEHTGPDGEIVFQIKELLDTRVRPAVAQDGGDITFHGFDRGVVYLHMQGACAGCPSSTMTLKMGIENLLKHYIPEVSEVRPVGVQL